METENVGWKFGNLYPNPIADFAYIVITAPLRKSVSIEIVNAVGQTFNQQTQYLNVGSNRISLPVQKLTTGIYMVRIRDEKGKLLNSYMLLKN